MLLKTSCKNLVFVWGFLAAASAVLAQDDALSAPQSTTRPKLAHTQASTSDKPGTEPADVVDQSGNAAPTPTPSPVSMASQPTPNPRFTPTPVKTPAFTPTPEKHPSKTVTPGGTVAPASQVKITTIPNPAYGDKVIFRVMAPNPTKAQIVIYDRFFNRLTVLSGEGDRLFDILWSLQQVPEGLYYYQAKVTNAGTGESQMIPMQSFAVMKDEETPNDR